MKNNLHNANETILAITTEDILNKKKPILYISHEHDGEEEYWQFYENVNNVDISEVMLVSLENILNLDQTISDMLNLPINREAVRKSIIDQWVVSEI